MQFEQGEIMGTKKAIAKINRPSIVATKKNVQLREESKIKLKWRDRWRKRMHTDRAYIITMMHNNGTMRTFVLKLKERTFTYKKKMYYVHYDESWFNITENHYQLFYHENHAIPINREITMTGKENWFNVTPENLKPLLQQEYVQKLATADELSRYLKIGLLIAIINIGLSVIIGYLLFRLGQ